MARAETDRLATLIDSLKNLSTAELAEIVAAAQRERETKIEEERQKLRAEIMERAAKLNLSVDDVMRDPETPKKKAATRYRGPDGEEWAGRGKPPKWLTSLEAAGRNRDEFKI